MVITRGLYPTRTPSARSVERNRPSPSSIVHRPSIEIKRKRNKPLIAPPCTSLDLVIRSLSRTSYAQPLYASSLCQLMISHPMAASRRSGYENLFMMQVSKRSVRYPLVNHQRLIRNMPVGLHVCGPRQNQALRHVQNLDARIKCCPYLPSDKSAEDRTQSPEQR